MTIGFEVSVSCKLAAELIDYREDKSSIKPEKPNFQKKLVVELALLGTYLLNLVETVVRLALGIIILIVAPILDCIQSRSGSIFSGFFLLTGAAGFSKILSMTQLFYSNFANEIVETDLLKIDIHFS